ncbi:MAG: hypothetical protein IT382_16225 [Deltaproteobacteria bacterium]|nr:hypothetical protein [Deltaproteobacteria bacterium]
MTTPCNIAVQSPQHTTRTRARQQALVDEAVTALQQRFPGKTVDVGEADSIVPAIRPTRATDRAHDGEILGAGGLWSLLAQESQVAPVLPNNGAPVTSTVILVNGIMTDAALHLADMQGLANTGCAVLGVRNATQGLARDLLECVQNKLDRGDTPAIDTLARLIDDALDQGRPVRVIGHSQGALITARALQLVEQSAKDAGLDAGAVKARLGAISVETYGGAANRYVDGPRYHHWINLLDIVPMLAGVGLDAINPLGRVGSGAVVDRFVEAHVPRNLPPLSEGAGNLFARAVEQHVHGPRDVYFRHRAGA